MSRSALTIAALVTEDPPSRRSAATATGGLVIAALAVLLATAVASAATAQERGPWPDAAPRATGEGPWDRLILRGATMIDGTGSPALGPVDVLIEGNRIARIQSVGYPGVEIRDEDRIEAEDGDHEIDLGGMYLLPGFVDMHGHIGGRWQGAPADYVFKLWLAHGITTVRDPGSGNGLDWTVRHREMSEENRITAPRIHAYVNFGQGSDEPLSTPELARAWVQRIAAEGADGIKIFGAAPEILAATFDEAAKQGIGTAMHHAQTGVVRTNVLDTARMGLDTMEHWYGLPEALFVDQRIQDYPLDYNYNDEQHRFGEAGRLWAQAAPPGSPRWEAVIDELIELDFTIDPTLTIYEASRDLMRARRAEWHDEYTLPALWDFYQPNRRAHGSYWFDWTTADEIAWKENYRLWMRFVDDYKNRGGRVTTGSDSGFIFKLYGFDYVRELELLQEAGFHPLEVIQSATLKGAEALGVADRIGTIEVGKLADLVVVPENPLRNFKVLYGTGAIRVDENNRAVRVGGVRYTIKDGIVYDAPKLLAAVRAMVAEAKRESGPLLQPGITADSAATEP
ncbi:MAG: amidohydrolase [Acidobacteria bacterium]|nr:MAG: amidohydrolase [Acidobacteriota bacterium]REK07728.1 MAG: amidohydrolase [Acidobacteriota bacterium]